MDFPVPHSGSLLITSFMYSNTCINLSLARTIGDDTITQAISTKGSGSVKKMERIITFPAKAGETIRIFCNNSGAGSRPLHLVNVDTKEEIKTIAAGSYKDDGPVHIDSTKVAANGTYGVFSTSGGMYIYKIEINK